MTEATDTELLVEELERELDEAREELVGRLEKVVLTGEDALDELAYEEGDHEFGEDALDEMMGDDLIYLKRAKKTYDSKKRQLEEARERLEE